MSTQLTIEKYSGRSFGGTLGKFVYLSYAAACLLFLKMDINGVSSGGSMPRLRDVMRRLDRPFCRKDVLIKILQPCVGLNIDVHSPYHVIVYGFNSHKLYSILRSVAIDM